MQEKRLIALISTVLRIPREKITRDADLIDDLGADSLSLAMIAARVEEEVGESLSADRLQDLYTVGDLLDLLNARAELEASPTAEPEK